jgi:hypothetical protein
MSEVIITYMGLLICFLINRQVGRNLIIPGGTRIIDARGKYVIPGNVWNFIYLSAPDADLFPQCKYVLLSNSHLQFLCSKKL